jgi:hypothetical protein
MLRQFLLFPHAQLLLATQARRTLRLPLLMDIRGQ